jgi:phage terminase large subunit
MKSAGISIIPEFLEKIELLNAISYFDVTKDEIRNKETGSDIIFRGIKTSEGNQTANLKSIHGVNCWVLDEAEELVDESIFDKIDDSIRSSSSPNIIILILNPVTAEHWIYKRFFAGKITEPEFNGVIGNVTYIHTTYEDNINNLSESFIQKVYETKLNNPQKYLHTYRGHWLEKAEGLIYTNTEIGVFNESLPYVYGLDYGFANDPDAMVKVAVDKKQKVVYLHEILYKSGNLSDTLITSLQSTINRNDKIIADNAEQRLTADIAKKGFNITAPPKAKVIERIKLLQDYKIIYTLESHNLHKELNNYCWNDKKAGVPIDMYNHLLDAAGYAFLYLIKGHEKARASLPNMF